MPLDSVYTRCVLRAAQLLGGTEALAKYLDLSPRLVQRWARGDLEPPDALFLKMVDLIFSSEAQAKHETRPASLPKNPSK